jgi:predicted DsbA family dithiol-disulfide isomerase
MLRIDIWADFGCPACYLAKPRIDQAQAARLEEYMAALARAQGQPYVVHHPVASSFDARRMLHLAAEHGAASKFMDTAQRDLLGAGINAYTAAYLADAATRTGVPATRAKALLAGDEYADAVRADEKLAREAGVTAVPFTVLGGRLAIPGAATASAYADAITQALTTGDQQ